MDRASAAEGGDDGSGSRAVRGDGCSQEALGCVRDSGGGAGDQEVRDDDGLSWGDAGLAAGVWGDTRGAGEHRLILEAVFNLLEGSGIEVLVVNAAHIKAVPGRKTDMNDAQWIAELLRHGLLRGSCIPDREHRELRELVRYRRSLIQERSREVARLQKVLEGANIKLSSAASNVVGVFWAGHD